MKLIISIGKKIAENFSCNELINLIKNYDTDLNISGVEIMSNNFKYINELAKKCKENNLIFQCHAPKITNIEEISEYLEELDKICRSNNIRINVVFHSIEVETIDNSIIETNTYIEKILNCVKTNEYNLDISLENLNYHNAVKRININRIDEILKKYSDLKFTYDMGHDLFDNKKIDKLSSLQSNRLNNVHIHCYIENQDHHPIKNSSEDLEKISKGIKYLKEMNYQKGIVLEYGIDFMDGIDINEKFIDYINSFKFMRYLCNNV